MEAVMTVRESGDVTVVDVIGRVTSNGGARDMHDAINGLLGQGRKKIVLHLAKTEWFDSVGIEYLAEALKKVRNEGGQLALLAPSKRIQRLLAVVVLDKHFQIFGNEDEVFVGLATA